MYCGGPECPLGGRAIELLSDLGYSYLSHYEGRIQEWIELGSKLEVSPNASSVVDEPTRHILGIIDSFSIGQWVFGWIGLVVGCAFVFWGGGGFENTCLRRAQSSSFVNCRIQLFLAWRAGFICSSP